MYLMTYGQRIHVDLTKCSVTENSSKTESTVIYECSIDNKTNKFNSAPLPYDKDFVLTKIKNQKETTIYADNKDKNKYFFDLDFIS